MFWLNTFTILVIDTKTSRFVQRIVIENSYCKFSVCIYRTPFSCRKAERWYGNWIFLLMLNKRTENFGTGVTLWKHIANGGWGCIPDELTHCLLIKSEILNEDLSCFSNRLLNFGVSYTIISQSVNALTSRANNAWNDVPCAPFSLNLYIVA